MYPMIGTCFVSAAGHPVSEPATMEPMRFIPPMLATRLTDSRRLEDPRYVAEPKLDGQRAQLHVRGGRVVACYSRPGLDLLRHAGFAWLRELAWPLNDAVFDGEA